MLATMRICKAFLEMCSLYVFLGFPDRFLHVALTILEFAL